MKAKSIKGSDTADLRAALEGSLVDGYRPTLAIVFISVKQDRKAVCEILQQQGIDIFGATSCGEFIDGHQSEGETAMLLLDVSRESYSIIIEDVENNSVAEAAALLAKKMKQHFQHPTFLLTCNGAHSDGQYFDGDTLVNTLVSELGNETVFFGGMAGDDWMIQNSFVFTHEREVENGIAALVFDAGKISLQGMAIGGWKPLGITRKVTKSDGNKVFSIDGKPAAEMYLKYLGMSEKTDDTDFDLFKDLSIHFPLIARRDDGEIVIKSPRSIEKETNALVMDIEMKEGSDFQFSTPPDFEISEEIISAAKAVKDSTEMQADALLIFSCAGRPPVLGPLTTVENDGLAEVWQVPMAGFYTYGEFGRMKNGKQHFHSSVCCWVAIREK